MMNVQPSDVDATPWSYNALFPHNLSLILIWELLHLLCHHMKNEELNLFTQAEELAKHFKNNPSLTGQISILSNPDRKTGNKR